MRADRAIHQRLREGRLVALVMPVAAIAEHVDDDRLVELLPVFDRDFGAVDDRFRVVAVGVEDRRLDQLGDVGRIGRGARVAGIGGEADLVVDDEMHRTAGAVAAQPRQAEAFGDDALAGEGRIAVDQQRQHLHALDIIVELILLGANLAEHDGIDDLEMRRIGGQRQMHLVAVEFAVRRGAQMVFDVARPLDLVGRGRAALEFVEDHAVRLAHHLAQHVEAAAMGHADRDLLDPQRAAALDDLLERRNHRFGAVEAEAFGAGIFHVEELLEALRLDELVENRPLALLGEGHLLVRPLDPLLHPGLFRGIGDVHELEAERAAIGAAQDRQHFRNRRRFQPQHVVDENLAPVVGLGEAVAGRVQLFVILLRLQPERIEIGVQMAAHAEGADHHQRAHALARRTLQVGFGNRFFGGRRRRRFGAQLVADRFLGGGPIAVERRNEVALGRRRPVGQLP